MALHGAFRASSYLRLPLIHSLSTPQFRPPLAITSGSSFHTAQYIRHSMSISSRSSTTSSTSSVFSASSKMSSTTPYATQVSSIAALPSFVHSLSALPRMTSVSSDMVHYGTLARTKQASEAKLQTALQTAKQRASGTPYTSLPSPLDAYIDDDDSALMIPRKAKTSFS